MKKASQITDWLFSLVGALKLHRSSNTTCSSAVRPWTMRPDRVAKSTSKRAYAEPFCQFNVKRCAAGAELLNA
jgi:hypothetical protein